MATAIAFASSSWSLRLSNIRPPNTPLFPTSALFPFPSCHRSTLTLSSASTFSNPTTSAYDDDDEWDLEEEDSKPPPTLKEAEEGGRLYVGNLPYSTTSSHLSQLFSEAGPVVSAEVIYDRVTDRSRGFAFVTMASPDHAAQAIRLFDGSLVGGRTMKVNFPEVPRGGERAVIGPRVRFDGRNFVDSPDKVYAGNLGWTVTSQDLAAAFQDQEGVLGARVVYDRMSGKSRGFGFVSFNSPENARLAIDNLDSYELEGRPLRLSLAAQRQSSSPASDSV